jgi:hypothetical protein
LTEEIMAQRRSRWAATAFATLLAVAPSNARAIDLQLFADHDKICAYVATAQAEDVAMVEIWLTILQRDAASGEGRPTMARDDLQRLDGEARTIERAIAVMDAQIVQGHVALITLRSRLRMIDALPESEAAARRTERRALQIDIRATSEELIEISFDLRDAKSRLASMQAAIAGRSDTTALIDAAQATVRQFGAAIRECAKVRRASLATVAPDLIMRR